MRPDFNTLEALPGHDLRMVNGQWMDREQYDMEGWFIAREYEREDGTKGVYWKARLDGLVRYGQLIYQRDQARKAIRATIRERDDEFADYVDSLQDARPNYPRKPE